MSKAALLASLTGDATLVSLLTGGVHGDVAEIKRGEDGTPAAFGPGTGEILPCALLKLGTDTPAGPHFTGSRIVAILYFYQRAGYAVIEQARDRVYQLWHAQKIGTNVWQIFHSNDVNDTMDDALGCSLIVSRYEMVRLR